MKTQRDCPICESPIDIPEAVKIGFRVTCPNCFAQLAIFKSKEDYVLGCALCKNPIFEPGNCGDCERRRENKKIYEAGL